MELSSILASIALLATAYLGYLQWRTNKQRTAKENLADDAGAADDISSAWKKFVDTAMEPLRARIVELETKVGQMTREIKDLSAGVDALVAQVEKHDDIPVYRRSNHKGVSLEGSV